MVDTAKIITERDIVSPQLELKTVKALITECSKKIKDAQQRLTGLAKLPSYTVTITVQDDKGNEVPLKGNDGKEYPAIVFDGVQGKTVRSYMANAAIALGNVMPDEENLRVRIGGELNRLQENLRQLQDRKHRAEHHIEVMQRREAGEPV